MEIVFSKHAADKLREIRTRDQNSAEKILASLRSMTIDFDEASNVKVVSRKPTPLYSVRGDKQRILITLDDERPDRIIVLGIVSADEPEGSAEEIKEVLASAAGA